MVIHRATNRTQRQVLAIRVALLPRSLGEYSASPSVTLIPDHPPPSPSNPTSNISAPSMTSSFSPTEFLHTSDRAWNLYRHCYTVAQTATRKLDILLPGLTTLSQSIQHLQEECDDPTSTLVTSGRAWIYAVKGIVRHAETTLVNIERYANRCERLGDPSRAMRSQKWDFCKAAFDGRKMKKLERQVSPDAVHLHMNGGADVL